MKISGYVAIVTSDINVTFEFYMYSYVVHKRMCCTHFYKRFQSSHTIFDPFLGEQIPLTMTYAKL